MAGFDELFAGQNKTGKTTLDKLFTPYDVRNVLPDAMVAINDDLGKGVYAGVSKRLPTVVQVNSTENSSKEAPHMLAHEMEHMYQNNVDSRYKNNDTNWDHEFIKQSKTPVPQLKEWLSQSAVNKTIPYYFQQTYNFPIKYYGAMDKGDYSLREQLAEISAAEQFLKKDLTKDPFVRKNVFMNNDNFINAYKATTGLRTNRLDSKDLPPMTVSK